MSVIAKMNVHGVRPFGDTALIRLGCVYDGDIHSENFENRRFTKASPSGEADLSIANTGLRFDAGKEIYVLFLSNEEIGQDAPLTQSFCVLPVVVHALNEMTWAKQVEIVRDWSRPDIEHGNEPKAIGKRGALNMRMTIDNPGASDQFAPGKQFVMALYRADEVDLHTAAAGK